MGGKAGSGPEGRVGINAEVSTNRVRLSEGGKQ